MPALCDSPRKPVLHLSRLPGEFGPILRCSGDLTAATVEALRREMDMLVPLGHPVLTINLSRCRELDVEGVVVLLDACRSLRERGRRLVLVAGTGQPGDLLRKLGLDWVMPFYASESEVTAAARGGAPPPSRPVTWDEARRETLANWQAIAEELDRAPENDLMRQVTDLHALCARADRALGEVTGSDCGTRCLVCPLFYVLGARPEDVGCQSIREPILRALLVGDRTAARRQVTRIVELIAEMPVPAWE